MAELQETLIYIEKENIEEAEFMSRNFVTREVKTRAYLNALGAELVMKYIKSEGINTDNLHNLHSISKILEKYDIADILLPNIHIDVRVVFDKTQLFIPKSHFENEITPDVYAFIIISDDFKTAEFLGYCETSAINKRKANSNYYFIDIEQLMSAETFAKFIKNHVGKNPHSITEEEMLRGRQLSVSLADHNVTKFEEKELLELLFLSDELRESVLEFDNFETLAYSAAAEVAKTLDIAAIPAPLPETDNIDIAEEDIAVEEDIDIAEAEEPEIAEADENITEIDEEISVEDSSADNLEILDTQKEEEEDLFGDSMLEDNVTLEEPVTEIEDTTATEEADTNTVDEAEIKTEPIEEPTVEHDLSINEEALAIDTSALEATNLSVDDILDQTIASIDNNLEEETPQPQPEKDDNKNPDTAGEIIKTAAETAAGIAGAAVTGIAGAAAAGAISEAATTAAASEGAMKLAGVSGEIISEVVDDNIHKQSENLDRIDSSLVGTNPEAVEISAEAEAVGRLSASKIEQNDENDKKTEFAPKDLSKLNKVDTIASETKEQMFVHETVNMEEMETVENDLYREETDSGVDIDTLTDLEAVKKKEEELTEAHILSESEVVELPDSMEYSINEDGSSTFDDIMMDKNMPPEEDTENLIDMAPIDDDNIIGSLNFDEISEPSIKEPENEINEETIEETIAGAADESTELSIDASDIDIPQETTIEDTISEIPLDIEEGISEKILEEPELSEAIENETLDTTESVDIPDDIDLDAIDSKIDTLMAEELAEANNQKDTIPSQAEDTLNEEIITEENNLPEEISVEDFPSELFEEENSESQPETEIEPEESKEQKTSEEETTVENNENEELSIEDFEKMIDESDENSDELKDNASIDDFLGITDEAQEVSLEDQDWLDETPADVANSAEAMTEDIIEEPEIPTTAPALNVVENSRIISDRSFQPGEIPIDINNSAPIELGGSESLEELYNPESPLPGGALLNNPGRMSAQNGNSKSPIGIIIGFVVVLIILVTVGAVGFGVAKMFKAPKEEAPQPITDDSASLNMDAIKTDNGNLDVNPNNVVSMDNNTNALASTAGTTATPASNQSAVTAARSTGTATAFVEIKKLSWEIPDYISQNASFQQYFQSTGKSLKNALTADLLLATDYIYSSPVKLSVTFDKDGTFKNSQIINSSGSTQIDSIVLQTVNQTFKALKAPNSVGNDQSTTAILKIYF